DGGRTWQASSVAGAAELDFRDVDAFDAQTAYLLSIGEGEKSRIYKTIDGGKNWTMQFKNSKPSAFFDAMAFWDKDHGIAVSDPVNGRFLIISTSDGGANWREMPPQGMPPALTGEGAFAASGTCLAVRGKSHVWFGTGGPEGARVFRSTDGGSTWQVSNTPVKAGRTAGIFSIAFKDAKHGMVVGGDYQKEKDANANAALTEDGGRTWELVRSSQPDGYRSCVAYVKRSGRVLVAVGPSGSDYSLDDGRSWTSLGTDGYHSLSFAGSLKAGWAVGEGGRIARFAGALPLGSKATRAGLKGMRAPHFYPRVFARAAWALGNFDVYNLLEYSIIRSAKLIKESSDQSSLRSSS
ncbi:MAG TPA: hypothetical protein VGB17_16610, partial [Pyrinomonadaceae bacterium]